MKLINLKDLPYLFTLLMGFMTWHLNYIITHETAAPLLAWQMNEGKQKKYLIALPSAN